MFAVVYATGGTSLSSLIVYGPFVTRAAAEAWIAAKDFPSFYYVCQVFPPPPIVPPATGLPIVFHTGDIIVAMQAFNLAGGNQVWIYGVFPSMDAANAFIAGRVSPSGCQVCMVQAIA